MAEFPVPFGPYLLLKSLGTGGGGDVCLAAPQDLARGLPAVVVIKRLHGQLAEQSEWVQRFAHEAEIAVSVDSPNLARSFDAGRVGDTFYIAMEYIAGWPLSRIIRDLQEAKMRSTVRSVATIMAGALSGLSALHTLRHRETGAPLGTVHRDIAPKNIMVGEDGVTRIIDLGIGKSTMQDWKTGTGVVLGSPGYMAPEQVAGERIDQRVDIYAMGIVLWEFLTLKSYFDRSSFAALLRAQHRPVFTPPSAHADVPPGLDEVCRRALSVDREARFSTAREFLSALEGALSAQEEEPQLGTVVRDMLVGELGQSKDEVQQLLAARRSAPQVGPGDARAGDEVVILAARAPAVAPSPVDPAEVYALAGGTRVGVAPFGSAGYTMGAPGYAVGAPGYAVGVPGYAMGAPGYAVGAPGYAVGVPGYPVGAPRPSALRFVGPAAAGALALAAAGLAVVLTVGGSSARIERAPVAEPGLRAEPMVSREPPRATASPREPAAEPEALAPAISTSRETRPREPPAKKPDAPPLVRVSPEPEARNVERSPGEIFNAMIGRAQAVRARSPSGSEPARAALRLINTLSLEAGRKDANRRLELEAELEAELRALEAQ